MEYVWILSPYNWCLITLIDYWSAPGFDPGNKSRTPGGPGRCIVESEIFYPRLKRNSHLFSLYTRFSFFYDSAALIFPLKFYPFVTFWGRPNVSALYMGCPALTGVGREVMEGAALVSPNHPPPALPPPPSLTRHGKSPQPLLRFTSFILFVPRGQPARPLNPPFIVHGAQQRLGPCSLISLMCLWTAAAALSASMQTLT